MRQVRSGPPHVDTGLILGSPGVLLSLICFFLHKGVIWLFLATLAEVPPAVGLQGFFSPLPISSLCYAPLAGIRFVESEWYFFYHWSIDKELTELNSSADIRSVQPSTS